MRKSPFHFLTVRRNPQLRMYGLLSFLSVAFTLFFSSAVMSAIETTSEERPEITAFANQLIIVAPTQVQVFLNEQMGKLMNGEASVPDKTFGNLADVAADFNPSIADLASKKLRLTVYFTGNDVISGLNTAGVDALKKLAAAGAILAVGGSDGSVLKGVLGIPERSLVNEIGTAGAIFLIYTTEELLMPVDGMSPRDILAAVFNWTAELDKQATARGDSPWNALARDDKRISFSDNNSARFLVELYKLAATSTDDWYRFDFSLTSTITSYSCNDAASSCGWYTTDSDLTATLSNGAQLYDYMPTGTIGDRTESFSIGGDISAGTDGVGAGVNAGYSMSYSTPDMSIRDVTNFSTNTAGWDVSFNGPDYKWAPWYTKPANVATASYTWKPSFIAKVPAGKKGVVCLQPTIRYKQDYDIHLYWLVTLKWSVKTSTWSPTLCYDFGSNGLAGRP